jgi:hypothetical protein
MKSSSPSILSLLPMAIGEGTFSLVVGGLPISVFSRLLPSVLTSMSEQLRWLVTCSCSWTRGAWSRWAAESMAKLHPKLSAPGTEHTITIEEPSAAAPPGTQIPLT